jgi:hypothetical protein
MGVFGKGVQETLLGRKPRLPDLEELNFDDVLGKSLEDYWNQYSPDNLDRMSDATNQLNKSFQERITDLYGNFESDFDLASDVTSSYLRGEIPQDVQDLVRRQTASQAIEGGFGIQSGMGRNLVARDFGLTSMNLYDKGLARSQQQFNLANAYNPFSEMTFINQQAGVGQLYGYYAQEEMYNNSLRNQQEVAAAARSGKEGIVAPIMGAVGAAVGGYFGGAQGAAAGGQLGTSFGSVIQNTAGGYSGDGTGTTAQMQQAYGFLGSMGNPMGGSGATGGGGYQQTATSTPAYRSGQPLSYYNG